MLCCDVSDFAGIKLWFERLAFAEVRLPNELAALATQFSCNTREPGFGANVAE